MKFLINRKKHVYRNSEIILSWCCLDWLDDKTVYICLHDCFLFYDCYYFNLSALKRTSSYCDCSCCCCCVKTLNVARYSNSDKGINMELGNTWNLETLAYHGKLIYMAADIFILLLFSRLLVLVCCVDFYGFLLYMLNDFS